MTTPNRNPYESQNTKRRKTRLGSAMLLVPLLYLTGCASIVSKSSYPVAIDSTPSGVSFFVTNADGARVHSGTTPSTVTLGTKGGYFKSQAYTIHLTRPGMPTKEYALRSQTDGWYWGNLLLGGFLGMLIVDPLTGAMFKYPAEVNVALDSTAQRSQPVRTLTIASIDTLTPKQQAALIPLSAN